jgi:hypothetical protein
MLLRCLRRLRMISESIYLLFSSVKRIDHCNTDIEPYLQGKVLRGLTCPDIVQNLFWVEELACNYVVHVFRQGAITVIV